MILSWNIANLLSKQISTPAIAPDMGTELEHRKFAKQVNQHSSCCTERCMGIVLSQNIANLLSKQISTLAVAQEVYWYGIEPEHYKFAEQAD